MMTEYIDRALAVADVVEVRHGKWVAEEYESVSKRNRIIKYKVYSCSVCGKSIGKARKSTALTAAPAWTRRRTNDGFT